jgi:hypothetical protein
MYQAPDWTEAEFKVLITNHALSSAELGKKLPARSIRAIDFVRTGIQNFHQGKSAPELSQMMKTYLTKKKFSLICAKCGEKF